MTMIIIPAYQPSEAFVSFIKDLKSLTQSHIIVVDDGSGASYSRYFEDAKNLGCNVITHSENLGKGAAIKTAISEASKTHNHIETFVTCDADGQHAAKDVLHLIEKAKAQPHAIILGKRNFKKSGIPFKNRFGNAVSSLYFYFSTGKTCADTQTGLRAIPYEVAFESLELKENRYDFEMAFLLKYAKSKYPLVHVPIETIYIDQNQSSHFRPIKDSYLIYRQPIRFTITAVSSAFIDVGLFALLFVLLSGTILEVVALATVAARIVSGIYNFLLNRMWSFNSHKNIKKEFGKYGLLYIAQLGASIVFVSLLSYYFSNPTVFKLIVDGTLFMISYQIQKRWVFA